jgi:superfamily II DNA or RNA helicase
MGLAFGGPRPRVVVRERVWVPHALVPDRERLERELTVHNLRGGDFGSREGVPDEYRLYEDTPECVIVPRAYPLRLRGELGVDYDIVDLTGIQSVRPWTDLVTLGPHQWQRFDQLPGFEAMLDPGEVMPGFALNAMKYGRTFVLRCGGGKTAISLKAAAARGGRFLWVTVTEALVDQMRGRKYGAGRKARIVSGDITKFLDIPYDKIGHVQGSKQQWHGFDCAVATLQTLAMSDKVSDAFWSYWDLVIFDEGDMLGAPLFNRVVSKFRGERWVLTATPQRNDRLEKLFLMQTGPICYSHTDFDLVPTCHFVPTVAPASHEVTYGWDSFKRRPRTQYALTAKNLLLDEVRTSMLLAQIARAVEKGRTVLVTGDSIEGMTVMRQRAVSVGIDAFLVTSGTKGRDRLEAIQTPPVVFATTRIFARGIDRVQFDTLFLASMVTVNPVLMQQLPGRILRGDADNPDKAPLIVVPVDYNIESLLLMCGKLASLCESRGWPVTGIGNKLPRRRSKW